MRSVYTRRIAQLYWVFDCKTGSVLSISKNRPSRHNMELLSQAVSAWHDFFGTSEEFTFYRGRQILEQADSPKDE